VMMLLFWCSHLTLTTSLAIFRTTENFVPLVLEQLRWRAEAIPGDLAASCGIRRQSVGDAGLSIAVNGIHFRGAAQLLGSLVWLLQ
jgi:hypothetical protein